MWPSMATHTLNLCSAFNPSKCTHTPWTHTHTHTAVNTHTHTAVNTHTHTAVNTHTHTHTRSSGQPMLRRPGSSRGFGALLKGLTSVVVLRLERAPRYSLPPPTIFSCRPETRTRDLWVTSPTLYPLGHDYPNTAPFIVIMGYCLSNFEENN